LFHFILILKDLLQTYGNTQKTAVQNRGKEAVK